MPQKWNEDYFDLVGTNHLSRGGTSRLWRSRSSSSTRSADSSVS